MAFNEELASVELLREYFHYDGINLIWKINRRCVKAGKIISYKNDDGYIEVGINYKHYRVHRVIWAMVHGRWPKGLIDHINGIRTDNRIENLREADFKLNTHNTYRSRAGIPTGISKRYGKGLQKWRIRMPGTGKQIGSFYTLEEAKIALTKAVK